MVAARVADEMAWIFTDFKIDNGFALPHPQRRTDPAPDRAHGATPGRDRNLPHDGAAACRWPRVGRWLYDGEKSKLADMMDRIGQARCAQDERDILASLSTLAAAVEHSVARTTFRFGASRAYHGLVMRSASRNCVKSASLACRPSPNSCSAACCRP